MKILYPLKQMKTSLSAPGISEKKRNQKISFIKDQGNLKNKITKVSAIMLLMFCYKLLPAQIVYPDSSFADVGIRDSIITNINSDAFRIKVLPNNHSIVLVSYDSPRKGLLVKLTPSGTYDNSFGTNGQVFFAVNDPNFRPIELLIQADNKILVIGATPPTDVRIYRFLSNGTPDNSFGVNGKVSITTSHNETSPRGAALLSNGKIIVCGLIFDYSNPIPRDMVMCLNTNGSLDPGFGNNGLVVGSYGSSSFSSVYHSIAILPNDQMVFSGYSFGLNGLATLVSKLNTNGSLNASFGNGGNLLHLNPFGYTEGLKIVAQPNGELIVGTLLTNNVTSQIRSLLLGLNSNGSVNTNFGTGGTYSVPTSAYNNFFSNMIVQNNGKINLLLVDGDTSYATMHHSIHRVNANGTSDLTFNSTSKKDLFIMNNGMNSGEIAIQPDGKWLVCGSEFVDSLISPRSAIVARFMQDTFSLNKNVTVAMPNGGENWSINESKIVSWNSNSVNNVNVFYQINNGPLFPIASNINNIGSAIWTTPTITSNFYKIIVQDATDWSILDSSNASFTISEPNTTGIFEAISKTHVSLAPNPTNDKLKIRINSKETVGAQIINELGQVLETFCFINSTELNVSGYKDGIYFIKLSEKENTIMQKFIVMH